MIQKASVDKKYHWLSLHLIPGLGNVVFKRLIERFESAERVFAATLSDLMDIEGVRKQVASHIVAKKCTADPEKTLRRVENFGARIIIFEDPEYPQVLKEIHDPPMLLYVKGKEIPRNVIHIAIVGSRNPTTYGMKVAEEFGQGLARRRFGVVSGMARGIDSAAHWGCLGGHGFTLAILGTGVDIIYPGSNTKLFHHISQAGAVISEFPLGTPPEPRNFPIRNRIISGLSRGVLVVEATKKSGSLITASLALEQGRDVFAVPGSINSFKSRGCHYLIKQGATLVENSDDILDELGFNYQFISKPDTFKEKYLPPLDASEKLLYDLIGDFPTHIDVIARESHLESAVVSSTLMRMELKGMIRQLPGKMFVR